MTKKPITIRPDEKIIERLDELAYEKGIRRNAVIDEIFMEYFEGKNKYESLDSENVCDALCFIDNHFECTWGREGRTPDIKKIGKTIEDKDERCRACTKTLEMKEELLTLKEKVEKGYTVDVPTCFYGGQQKYDKNKLYIYCKNPHMLAEWREVNKWCKVVRNGANCEHISWSKMHMKGELREKDNR